MDTTATTDLDQDDTVDTPAEAAQWELPDVDLPEPELSTAAWDGPLPEVEDHQPGGFPRGMVVGGSALGAAIIGLGVFSAFGLAGVAAAAAVSVAAAPAAAIGVSDYRRRLQTGRWRPSATGRSNRGTPGVRPNGRNAPTASTKRGLFSGRRSGLTRKTKPAGSSSGGTRGGKHRAASGGLRRAASGSGLLGRRPAKTTTGARSGGLGRPAGGSGRGRLGRALRNFTGRRPHSSSRRTAGHRRSGGPGGMLSRQLPGRRPSSSRQARRSAMNTAGMPGVRGWAAARAARRASVRQQRAQRVAARRQSRWDRRDQRSAARRAWFAKRQRKVRKHLRKTRRRVVVRAIAVFSSYPFRRTADGIRWAGRRAARAGSAAWARIVGSRLGRAARRVWALNWGSLLMASVARMRQSLWSLMLRMPRWLGAPTSRATAAAAATAPPVVPDQHDDERDSDAPAVTRPGRRPRPVMSVPPPAGKAPAVATPRSKRRNAMSGAPMHPAHQAVVDAFREAIGGWQPPDEGAYEEYEQFFSSWQEMFEQLGDEVAALGDRFRDESPLETAPEYLHEVATGLNAMGEAGSELYESWRSGNAADIDRFENPRPNEKQLNVV